MSVVIDVHCHLFNADDIPVEGFVDARAPRFIAVILDRILQGLAPGDRAEMLAEDDDELSDEAIDLLLRRCIEDDDVAREAFQEEMAGSMQEDALLGFEKLALVRRYIRWIHLMVRSKSTMVRKLLNTYPEVGMFVPLMMDMDNWFADSAKTPFRSQIDLLARITAESRGKIHPFVAFDPERERQDPGGSDGSLALVRDAIMNKGFLGVKVYPPLGYMPTGNVSTSPPLVYGREYDEAFEGLYQFCESNGVPITTHCTNGGAEAQEGFGKYADPDHWEPILEKHKDLRLNFAHFGGDKDLVQNQQNSWAWKIGRLMQLYTHVYADTGHHSITFDERLCTRYFELLAELCQEYPKVKDRIMFGSDWHMIVRAEKHKQFYKRYYDNYSKHFSQVETERFIGGNAVGYLGLATEEKNYTRLQEYYVANGLPYPSWWEEVAIAVTP